MQKARAFSQITLLTFSLMLCVACQQKNEASFSKQSAPAPAQQDTQRSAGGSSIEAEAAAPFKDAAANGDIFSSAAAVPGAIDSLKKFVRTAQMRFRVNNTVNTTLRIEDIVLRNGGFMVSSNLNTEVQYRQTTPISSDSALETTRYVMQSQLHLRVPYRMLDTTLRSIGRLADFLDQRSVQAEDVGLQLLESELTRIREGIYRGELAQSGENKLSPKADRSRESRAASDQARIETLKIEDAIRYSTVSIDLYQLPQVHQIMVANTDTAVPQAALAIRMGNALRSGAELLTVLFLALLHLWAVILLVLVVYLVWKLRHKRKAAPALESQKS